MDKIVEDSMSWRGGIPDGATLCKTSGTDYVVLASLTVDKGEGGRRWKTRLKVRGNWKLCAIGGQLLWITIVRPFESTYVLQCEIDVLMHSY
jgi:hypothetical protein